MTSPGERSFTDKLESFCKKTEMVSAVLAVLLLLINVGDIVMGVVLRYVFSASVVWTEEVARYSLVWLVLLGAAGALARRDHMAVDFLVPRFPGWLKAFSWLARVGVQICVLAILIWYGIKNVGGTWQMKTMALGIPKAIPLMAVPIGMALLLLQLLAQEWHSLMTKGDAQ